MGKTSVLNDQYYTKQNIAIDCLKILKNKLLDYIEFENEVILEPSAGTGSFIEAANIVLKPKEILAIDIEPKHKIIKKKDSLHSSLASIQKTYTSSWWKNIFQCVLKTFDKFICK